MKILLTGAGGQLGQDLGVSLKKLGEVIPTTSKDLDIINYQQVREVLLEKKPNVVVNSAAFTDVEACAKDPQKAILINAEAVKNLSQIAKEVQAKFVYISSNEVFNGESKVPYTENDQTDPINPYAKSKLIGEQYTKDICGENYLIIRSSWLYGPGSKTNFPNKIIDKAKTKGKLSVVDDEISVPTYTPDLASWVTTLLEKNQTGVFHLVNDGAASRFDWASHVVELLGLKTPIIRTKLADYPRLSKPPKYSVLSNEKAKKFGVVFRDWQEASKEYLTKLSQS